MYKRQRLIFIRNALSVVCHRKSNILFEMCIRDSHYLDEGVDAEYNWQVVEKLVTLIRAMGLEPATPDEARQMLNMYKR